MNSRIILAEDGSGKEGIEGFKENARHKYFWGGDGRLAAGRLGKSFSRTGLS